MNCMRVTQYQFLFTISILTSAADNRDERCSAHRKRDQTKRGAPRERDAASVVTESAALGSYRTKLMIRVFFMFSASSRT